MGKFWGVVVVTVLSILEIVIPMVATGIVFWVACAPDFHFGRVAVVGLVGVIGSCVILEQIADVKKLVLAVTFPVTSVILEAQRLNPTAPTRRERRDRGPRRM